MLRFGKSGLIVLIAVACSTLCMKCGEGDGVQADPAPIVDSTDPKTAMTDSSRPEWKEVDALLTKGINAQNDDYPTFVSILHPSIYSEVGFDEFVAAKSRQDSIGILITVNNYRLTRVSPIVEDSLNYCLVTWHYAERVTHFAPEYAGNPAVFVSMLREQYNSNDVTYDEANREIVAAGELKLYAIKPKSGGEWKFLMDGFWNNPNSKDLIGYDAFIQLRQYEKL